MNVLNQEFTTVYNTAPFSKISDSDFLPAFKKAIQDAKAEIDAIVKKIISLSEYKIFLFGTQIKL